MATDNASSTSCAVAASSGQAATANSPLRRTAQRPAPAKPAPWFLAAAVQRSGHPDQLRKGVAGEGWPPGQRSNRDPVEQSEAIHHFLRCGRALEITARFGLRWPALTWMPWSASRSLRAKIKGRGRIALLRSHGTTSLLQQPLLSHNPCRLQH